MSFASEVAAHNRKAAQSVDKTVRAITFSLFREVVMRSPVDTGRFKGNWQVSQGTPVRGTLTTTDASGGVTIANIAAGIGGAGSVTYLANNLPYAQRLEYDGWSGQARQGMVRVSMARVQSIAASAIRANKV